MVGNSADSAIVRLDNVGVTYPGGVTALRATSIAFRTSEFVVLLGRSGAGKSTLLRTLNHLVPPTTGHIVSREIRRAGSAAFAASTPAAHRIDLPAPSAD
jgi:phosphonate transport system ATP-binding protein